MKVKPEGNFAIQMFAKQPGHVIVSLSVSPHPSSGLQLKDNNRFSDEVQIQVLKFFPVSSLCVLFSAVVLELSRSGASCRLFA